MSRRNVFPKFLGTAHPRFHTPAASLVVQGIWSALLLFSGTFDTLSDTLIFVSWIFYAAGAYGVFVLRRKDPDAPRPYKVPGYPVVPWIFILLRNDLPFVYDLQRPEQLSSRRRRRQTSRSSIPPSAQASCWLARRFIGFIAAKEKPLLLP